MQLDPRRFWVLSPDVILRAEPQFYETYAVFHIKRSETTFLSVREYSFLRNFSSPKALEQVCATNWMPTRSLRSMMKRFLDLGYIEPAKANPARLVDDENVRLDRYSRFPVPFLSAPSMVHVYLTNRCNLKCAHCFSDSGSALSSELTTQEIKSILDQLEEMHVLAVRLTGGEPLLRKDILELLEYFSKKRFRRLVVTNGTFLNDEIVALMKRGDIIPTISLDGATSEIHDSFRGIAGSFRITIQGIRALARARVEFGINYCVNTKNIAQMEDAVKLAIELGASRIAFLDLFPTNRLNMHAEWIIDSAHWKKACAQATRLRRKFRGKIDVVDWYLRPCPHQIEAKLALNKGYVSCIRGIWHMIVGADGYAYPEDQFIYRPHFRIGSIREQKLTDIWFSEKWLPFRGGTRLEDLARPPTHLANSDCELTNAIMERWS